MKMRTLTLVLSVVGLLAFTACKETGGAGGGGGSGATGGNGGSGGGACEDTCANAITVGGDVCGGSTFYEELVGCAQSACASECADLIQNHGASDTTCGACLTDSCSTELNECSNN